MLSFPVTTDMLVNAFDLLVLVTSSVTGELLISALQETFVAEKLVCELLHPTVDDLSNLVV